MEVLTPTLLKHQTPEVFHKPHVESGYRQPGQPWRYYWASVLQKHNECLNTWTHIAAFVCMALRLYDCYQRYDLAGDPYMWPLVTGTISALLLYWCSAGAHWFQSRSELVHYTCFLLDYAGIAVFSFGMTLLHFFYSSDPWLFSLLKDVYVPVGILLCAQICISCSTDKTMYRSPYRRATKLWKMVSMTAAYVWAVFPVLHRLVRFCLNGQWDDSMADHVQQIFWMLSTAFFFVSDIPQRLYPAGKFDFLGHSHQLFHICMMMTSFKQMDAMLADIAVSGEQLYSRPVPTFASSVGGLIAAVSLNLLIALGFREYVKRSAHNKPLQNSNDRNDNGNEVCEQRCPQCRGKFE